MDINFDNIETTFNSLTNLTKQHTAGIMQIIKMHSYYCYLINRVRSIICPCVVHETKQADVNCPLCLGTGNKIKIYKIFCAAQDTKLPTTFRSDNFIVARDYYMPSKYRVNDDDLIIDNNEVYIIYEVQEKISLEGTIPYNKISAGEKKFDSKIFLKNFYNIINKVK